MHKATSKFSQHGQLVEIAFSTSLFQEIAPLLQPTCVFSFPDIPRHCGNAPSLSVLCIFGKRVSSYGLGAYSSSDSSPSASRDAAGNIPSFSAFDRVCSSTETRLEHKSVFDIQRQVFSLYRQRTFSLIFP